MTRQGSRVGIVLALLFFVAAAGLMPAGRSAAQETTAIATPEVTPAVTPTVDRLAAPPTVENPNQADEGAQLYWLHCLPCHGDQGQGLTDEWRAQYPPEDQNCWESGCHGNRPYEEGFILPTAVPALVGEGSLQRFEHWGEVYGFVRASMPYQAAGSLTEEEYLAIVAFLARANERWDGTVFDANNVVAHGVRPPVAPTATATTGQPAYRDLVLPAAMVVVVVLAAVAAALWRNRPA
jgi:cytochrome c